MSQHRKILNLLADGEWHCTSQMRELFMADPPKRLQELGEQVECGGRCTLHSYHQGGVKMWRIRPILLASREYKKGMDVEKWNSQFYPPKEEDKRLVLF